MGLFVFVTESCRADAERHGLTTELERFAARVGETQSTSSFDPFPPPYLVKKKFGGRQGRLVAELRMVSEHSLVLFQAVIIRGTRDYDHFSEDPVAFGRQHFAGNATEGDLAAFVGEQTRVAGPAAKPEPSEAENMLLYNAFSHRTDGTTDDTVCETPRWIAAVAEEAVANHLNLVHEACLAALYRPEGVHAIPVEKRSGWTIHCLRKGRRLLLSSISTMSAMDTGSAPADEILARLDAATDEDLLRESRRAYPAKPRKKK